MKTALGMAALLGAVLVAACGGGGSSVTLSVAPETAKATAGGSTITFTATTSGDAAAVAWNLEGPGNISTGKGASTIYTPPATLDALATATLAAELSGKSAKATITVDPFATVSGTVVNTRGAPISGALVAVEGKGGVVANASGAFTVTGVKIPYRIAATDTTWHRTVVYDGLRRTDPTLVVTVLQAAIHHTEVGGKITGGIGFPAPANSTTAVAFGNGAVTNSVMASPQDGTYNLMVNWPGEMSISGTLRALQWLADAADGTPTMFTGSGVTAGLSLTDHLFVQDKDLALGSVETATLSGGIAADARPMTVAWSARFGDGISFALGQKSFQPGASFSLKTPSVSGVTLQVAGLDFGLGKMAMVVRKGLAPNATGVNLTLPPSHAPMAPASGATGVDANTVFSWYALGTAEPHVYLIWINGPGRDPVQLVTAARQFRPADLSAVGVSLPGSATLSWAIAATTGFASVEEAASPGIGDEFESIRMTKPGATSYTFGYVSAGEFTTAAGGSP